MRTPMHWRDTAGGGFTDAGRTTRGSRSATPPPSTSSPSAPIPIRCSRSTRALIALRKQHADLHSGSYETIAAPDGAWAWRRGASIAIAMNLTDAEAEIADVTGRVLIGTDRSRDGEMVSGSIRLGPWQAVVVER